MTQPSEEEVRAYLTDMAYQNEILSRAEAYRHAAAVFRAALALLDAGRKDRERRIRAENLLSTFRDHAFLPELLENDVEEIDAFLHSTAIGQARGA